jgi:hypothetical protein
MRKTKEKIMQVTNYNFNKKCSFDMCQNEAKYAVYVAKYGNVTMCEDCAKSLVKNLSEILPNRPKTAKKLEMEKNNGAK